MAGKAVRRVPGHIVHMTHIGGHHGSYIDLFGRLFAMTPSVGRVGWGNVGRLVRAERLMFGTLDDDVRGFLFVSVLRAFLGRRTAGIFMRPQSCFFPGLHGHCKRLTFAMVRRVPGVSTLSLLPFKAMPQLAQVASTDVHDPQLWDVVDDVQAVDRATWTEVTRIAAGRPVLTFLGTVTLGKGVGFLDDLVAARPDLAQRLCIIIAGEVKGESRVAVDRIVAAGATLWNRRTSDAELVALYQLSDAVWACYHPLYDQASGIFGRALQLGRLPVIRRDAVVVPSYAATLQIDSVALPDDATAAAGILLDGIQARTESRIADRDTLRRWREEFIDRVHRATSRVGAPPYKSELS